MLFGIFPMALVTLILFHVTGMSESAGWTGVIPPSTMTWFETLRENTLPPIISMSFVLLVWAAARLFRGLMRNLDAVYGTHTTRRWYVHVFGSLLLTLLASLAFLLLSSALIIGEWAFAALSLPMPELTLWIIAAVAGVLICTTLYHLLPAHLSSVWHRHLFGGCLAVAVWLAGTVTFQWLVPHMPSLKIYGVLSSAIVLIMYIQICAYAFLIGAYINHLRQSRRY